MTRSPQNRSTAPWPSRDTTPPHVDDVFGAPPPPPGRHTFRTSLGEASSPHSRARLLLLLGATPVMSAIIHFARGSEGGLLLWAAITVAAMVIVAVAWTEARREAQRAEEREMPPVLAHQAGGASPLAIVLPFVIPFLFLTALLFSLGETDARPTLATSVGLSLFFGLLWHLRGTIPGLVLVALAGGACVGFFLEVLDFIGGMWGTGEDFNFWTSTLLAAAVIAPCVWPWWRRLRDLPTGGAGTRTAVAIALVLTVLAAVAGRSAVSSQSLDAPTTLPTTAPTAPGMPPAGPIGAPTQQEAAAALFAAWRFDNRAAAGKVASETAIDTLFRIPSSPRDRLLGCGMFEGSQFSECRMESMEAGVLTLGWSAAGNGTFYIDYVAPTVPR